MSSIRRYTFAAGVAVGALLAFAFWELVFRYDPEAVEEVLNEHEP